MRIANSRFGHLIDGRNGNNGNDELLTGSNLQSKPQTRIGKFRIECTMGPVQAVLSLFGLGLCE